MSHDEKMKIGKKSYKSFIQGYVDQCGGSKLTENPKCRVEEKGKVFFYTPEVIARSMQEDGPKNFDVAYYLENSGYTTDNIMQDIGDTWSTKTKVGIVVGLGLVGGGIACGLECPRKAPSPP